jgi:hypothetical protein
MASSNVYMSQIGMLFNNKIHHIYSYAIGTIFKKYIMLKGVIYSILLITITNCSAFYHPMFMPVEPPDGPPEFQAGWRDGCRTGLATKKSSNSSVYRATFGSGVYQHDKVYQDAWGSAFYTCYVLSGRATANHIFARSPAD